MKLKTVMTAIALLAVGTAYGEEACPDHDHDHGHAHGAGVEVSESAAQAMGLRTVRPEKRRLRSMVSLQGRVELAPDARRVSAAPVAGRIDLRVRSLQEVRPGDLLFTIDAPECRAKAKEIEVLEQRLKVYRGIGRTSAELETQLSLRKAEREAMLAGAEATDGVIAVRAAVAGRVEALAVPDGSWVGSGTTVVELVQVGRVRFKCLLPTSVMKSLRDGMRATCGNEVGRLSIGLADETGLTPVYVIFDTELTGMRPGEAMRADCVTDEGESPVTAVPSVCVVRVGLEPTVFVRDEDDPDRFLAVKVSTGRVNGGWTEVKGLPEDDDLEIVKEGAYELKIALAAQSGSAPKAGHFHADGKFHEGDHD